MPDVHQVVGLTRRVAGFDLPIGNGQGSPLPISEDTWGSLLGGLVTERLTGLAVAAAEEGYLRLSEGQMDELLNHQRGAMLAALALERKLLVLSSIFDEVGIDYVVLKGPAVAHSLYPDPSWRPFGDLDLLVRTRDLQRVCDLLPEVGFRRYRPEPRPGFVERFGHAALYIDGEGLQLDVHRTLVAGPFGVWIDPDELFERTRSLKLASRQLRRLDDTALFLHACIHASLGNSPPLLMPLRDVGQALGSVSIDWERVTDWAVRWRLRPVLQHALLELSTRMSVELPEEAARFAAIQPSRAERRVLAAYTTRRRRGGKALATLKAAPGVRAKVIYLWALLLPSRQFLVARAKKKGRKPSYVRRWARPFRWLIRRHRWT